MVPVAIKYLVQSFIFKSGGASCDRAAAWGA
jgi:hypothetical protein